MPRCRAAPPQRQPLPWKSNFPKPGRFAGKSGKRKNSTLLKEGPGRKKPGLFYVRLGLVWKIANTIFLSKTGAFCVGNPRNTTVFLAVSALKPPRFVSKTWHFLYFQTSPKQKISSYQDTMAFPTIQLFILPVYSRSALCNQPNVCWEIQGGL